MGDVSDAATLTSTTAAPLSAVDAAASAWGPWLLRAPLGIAQVGSPFAIACDGAPPIWERMATTGVFEPTWRAQHQGDSLDVPSLALAIRHCDVDAVQELLAQGAPLDPTAWVCHDALEMAECMAFCERMHNATYSRPDMKRYAATRIVALLKTEKVRRAAGAESCTWHEPEPDVISPGAVGDVESRPWHGAAWFHHLTKEEQRMEATDYWQRACTCASRRIVPWKVDQCGCEHQNVLGSGCRAFTMVPVKASREHATGMMQVETGESHAVLDIGLSLCPRCGMIPSAMWGDIRELAKTQSDTYHYRNVVRQLRHDCCKGTPRGLCAAHEAQGSRFMHELCWKFDDAKGMWVHDEVRALTRQDVFRCRRFHGPDCTRKECPSSKEFEHPKPAHRPPDGMMWDAKEGVWVANPDKVQKQPKAAAPSPPQRGATDAQKKDWLQAFSAFDGREWRFPDEYRAAYKKAKRPADDSERRMKQRRASPAQQATHRASAKGKEEK